MVGEESGRKSMLGECHAATVACSHLLHVAFQNGFKRMSCLHCLPGSGRCPSLPASHGCLFLPPAQVPPPFLPEGNVTLVTLPPKCPPLPLHNAAWSGFPAERAGRNLDQRHTPPSPKHGRKLGRAGGGLPPPGLLMVSSRRNACQCSLPAAASVQPTVWT